jgi:hypothetical protein
MARVLVRLALVVAPLGACSSASAGPDELADPLIAGRASNPEGVPYPTDNLGGAERAGGRPGQRVPNFTFQAYPDGDRSAGLRSVSLADYYDPTQKRFKLLDIQVSATWCSVCSSVTSATVPIKARLAAEGVAFLDVVVAGHDPSAGPSLAELDAWVEGHTSNYTTAADVRGQRLRGVGVDPTAVPYDLLIDPRTMEILDSSVGAPLNFNVEAYVRDGLRFVASHPPSY